MDFAAEVFAGQAVGEFMQRADDEERQPRQHQRLPTQAKREMTDQFPRVVPNHHGRGQDAAHR